MADLANVSVALSRPAVTASSLASLIKIWPLPRCRTARYDQYSLGYELDKTEVRPH
jgi:hypothetical protein